MATEGKKFTNRTSSLLSVAKEKSDAKKQQASSSSAAAKSWSTSTPTVTSTPKVTSTAKAMPSLVMPDVSKIIPQTITPTKTTATNTTKTASLTDLLKPRTSVMKTGYTDNLLSPTVEKKEENTTLPLNLVKTAINLGWTVAKNVANTLYDQWMSYIKNKIKTVDRYLDNASNKTAETTIDFFNYMGNEASTEWNEWTWIWMVKDTVLNTIQWLPRWIARTEYWIAELLDWGIDAKWATDLKNEIKRDVDYWENTKTYQKVKNTESFSDFLKNPLMYAGWTFTEMLPMFINAWVAVPTTFAQIYWETYSDYSQDESLKEAWLTDNQVRLMSMGVAWVNTIIELWSDLIEWIMPWTRPTVKTAEKEVRKRLTKPFMKVFSNFVRWWLSEWVEEVLQNEMQDQAAWFAGSDRDLPTWADRITTFWISSIIWMILQWGNVVVDVKKNKEIKQTFNEWSEAVDEIAPGVSEEDKVVLFSSIVAAKVEDANMSEDKVANYEAQTTELYNRIDELTEQLNNTTNEEEKNKINSQIEDANEKIRAIDEIINKWNAMVEKVNQQLQEMSQKRMEEQQEKETQAALEGLYNEINWRTWGENLDTAVKESVLDVTDKERTPEFKNWFGDWESNPKNASKAVNKDWTPLHLYHWTRYNISIPNMKRWIFKAYWNGMYFTTSEESAKSYSKEIKNLASFFRRPRVMEVYLNIRNPIKSGLFNWKEEWTEKLKELGYEVDEWYLANKNIDDLNKYETLWMMQSKKQRKNFTEDFSKITWYDGLMAEQEWEQYWVAWRPNQVKSVNNRWTFSVTDDNVKKSVWWRFKLPTTPEWYKSLAEALRQPNNTILDNMSVDELNKTFKDLKKFSQDNPFVWIAAKEDILFVWKKIAETIAKKNEENTKKTTEEQDKVSQKITFKNAQEYVDKMLDVDERVKWSKLTKKEREELGAKYMSNFIRNNLEWDFSRHLPWLKWVNLKHVEWQLTDEKLQEISEMLALVSATFGVDFNKIIEDKKFSMNISDWIFWFLYNPGTLGIMVPKHSRERIKEFLKRTWTKWNIYDLWAEIATAWVVVTLWQWKNRAGSIMSHELFHLIDFALSTEEWLPIVLRNKWKKKTIDYTSIIEWDYSWKTFKKGDAKKWTKDYNYYNDWSEILARYAEQYFAYKNAPEVFKELAWDEQLKIDRPRSYYNWYWSEDEFLKLLPKFESFIKNRLWAKLLDEENIFYHDIVSKINEWLYDYKTMEHGAEKMNQTELQLKLLQMETNYAWILQTVEWMKWDLKEEMEAYVQLSNLQSNYEMAKAKGEEYLEKLRTTPEQQDTIDEMTTTVLPPVETPENPNPVPPQEPEKIMLWLPYYWWSSMENWIDKIAKGESTDNDMKEYTDEEKVILKRKKGAIRTYWRELKDAWFDAVTPAISRIYNRSPRVAWRLITMETQTQINTHRYREMAKWFVESLWKLKGKDALEVKMALLDYWALASEQTEETINEYKHQEVIKLRNVLLKHWFKEQDINDMFYVLNDIWRQYKDAWLDISLTDLYFPRVVKDYEWLIEYMNRVSGGGIKVNKTSLLMKIREIQEDPNMTPEEKERKIRSAISIEFHQPWTTSKHGKERKLWLLSERWPWIYAYYENPIQSIDHYIVTMTSAIQRQLFLGWMREDAGITEWDILNQNTAESVSTILWRLVEWWMVDKEDVDIIQKAILSVLNKKASPKVVTAAKDITYISTITNFLSAINQLDDLWMVILRDRSWLKNIVKTIFWKAWIKYDDLWLDDSYEMFREEWSITNWLFKKSFFNTFDRLGKTSFINTAWESMVRQAKNDKTKKYLKTRLITMYWAKSAERMMKKIEKGDYKWDNWQMDIEILRDLLYQLWSTQPIYTSAMPVAYLNHPWTRLCYALSSFTLKRIDWLVQWAKEVNRRHWPVIAWAWVMWVSTYLALFWAIIWDAGDWLKWKEEDTFLWNLLNKWIDEALKKWWSNALNSWLKIWDLSDYDIQTWDKKGMYELLMSKVKPFIFDLWEDMYEAIKKHDANEVTDLAKYVPIFGKLVYYWCWDDLESTTKSKSDSGFVRRKDDEFTRREEEWLTRREEGWFIRRK